MLIPSKGSWIQHPEEVKAKRFTTERRKKMNSFSYVVNSNLHQLFIVPLDSSWVPVSVDLPMFIKPRKGFENGIIETKEDYFKVFHPDEKIIEMVLTAKEEIDRLTVRCERQRERAERWTVKYNDLRDRYDRLTELFYHNEDKIDQLFAEYEALLQQTEREKDQEIIDLENQVHLKERQVRETENTYYKYGYGEALDDNRRAIRIGQKELKKDYEKRLQAKVDKLICGIFWQDDGEPVQWLRRAIKRVNGVAGNCPVIINDESYECEYKGEAGYHTTPSGKTVVNHPGAYGYRTVYHCSTERLEVGVGWINRNIKKLAMSEAKMKVKK